MRYSDIHRRRNTLTPQSQAIPGRAMIPNAAGGYTFQVDPWMQLRRFLVTGTLAGTYYTSAQKLTLDNVEVVRELLDRDPERVVNEVVAVSTAGRAPSNDPALYVLALAAAHPAARRRAADALPQVARIGTHLFHFAEFAEAFRGWGRLLREAVAGWYVNQSAGDLAYQAAKYRQRDGWSHRDLLRLAHPAAPTAEHAGIYDWICGRGTPSLEVLRDADALAGELTERQVVKIVERGHVSWEMIPSEKRTASVWKALVPRLPVTATVRNLGALTANGVLKPLGQATAQVVARLRDADAIRKARVHPLAVLLASGTYATSHGQRGSLSWQPIPEVLAALDEAFYAAFGNVVPMGKRVLLAIDVSGSMSYTSLPGTNLSCRAVAAALALVTARVEPRWHAIGYDTEKWDLPIAPGMRLAEAVELFNRFPGRGTDCAVPVEWALEHRVEVDVFVNLTDNETWAGLHGHPAEVLRRYREKTGIASRMVVVGLTATQCSIADPDDPLMLDVAGFDAATPEVISEFGRL
ncbi:MAG: TROVE domain-containing protein [Armatimonadetes bacterium]|nr:TROVE domain-containing protein [Armatimonadota bacterium]